MSDFLKSHNPQGGFCSGYGREDVTPKEPIGLPGFANTEHRISTEVRDPIFVTCLAFSQGNDTVLMYSMDTLYIDARSARIIRKVLNEQFGVPENRIFLCATHTHSGPAYYYEEYFNQVFLPGLVCAAKNALADLAPSTIYGAKTETDRLNSVRHYITADGSYIPSGAAVGQVRKSIVRNARETDPEMILVKFVREGDKKDICLINWQCHPCSCYEFDTYLSADFIAVVRENVEKQTGMQCIYFSGANGDLGRGNIVPSQERRFDNSDNEFGTLVANTALAAIAGEWTKIEGSGIRTVQNNFEYTTNRRGIERLEDALKVKALAEKVGSYEQPEANNYAKELGFSSARECATIVMNASKPEKAPIELNALYVSGLAFATAPYEMFAENGMFIKKNSPYPFTIINELTNNYLHYFPVREAYEAKNIYEAKTADFAIGVAEASADQLVSMLMSL